jgi:AcrR family transcriptional regulator
MSVQERKERERASRERLIVATARELAEQQGWDAVTTRRLAERIEYSQPVLYSHFRGKREIIGAVALQGATEMAAAVRAATGAAAPRGRVTPPACRHQAAKAERPRARVSGSLRSIEGGSVVIGLDLRPGRSHDGHATKGVSRLLAAGTVTTGGGGAHGE